MTFDAFFLIVLMLVLGKLCAQWRVFPESAAEAFNLFILYFCLPAAVLRYGAKLELGPEILAVAVVPWALMGLSFGLILLLARMFGWSRPVTAVLLLCVPLGNTSYLGYPLVQAMLGEEGLPYAVIYDQFGAFPILATYGLLVLAHYSGETRPTPWQIGKKILSFPPFIALVLALTVMPAQPHHTIETVLARLSDALLPLAALAVGLQVKLLLPREELAPLALGLSLKLLVLPVLALAWVWLTGMPPLPAQAVVLETAMPTMVTAAVLAISHRIAPNLAAAMVGYGLVLSILTLPLWHWLLQGLAWNN